MNELSKLLQENLNIEFISATLSNPKNKDGVQKVKVRPILKKDVLYFQLESFQNNQAFHENVEEKKACEILLKYMENMRQMQMETQRAAYTILVSKKGKVTIKSKMKKGEKKQINMSHDRKKKYVLEEGVPVPFLQDLGVMTQDGQNVWYDYSGQQAELLKDSKTAEQGGKAKGIDLNSLPDQNAQGESLASANTFSSSEDGWTAVVSKAATKGDDAVDVGNGAQLTAGASGETSGDLKSTSLTSSTTGYNSGASASTAGYINPRKNFKGSIQRDTNGNIRSVVFVQQAN